MSLNKRMMLVTFTAKQILWSRRTAMLMLLSFFPLVIIGVWMYNPDGSTADVFSGIFIALFLQFILLIITLLYGTSLINSEIASRTISYLSTRPVRREELYGYRYLGSIPIGFFTLALPIAVCLIALDAYTGSFDVLGLLPEYCVIILVGVVTYSSFFAFLGMAIKRPLMVGLLFAFFWEILLANLPGKIPYMTVMFYLRSLSHHLTDAPWPYTVEAFSTGMALLVLLGVAAVFLALGIVIFRQKDLVE